MATISRDYAKVEALYILLLRRVNLSKSLTRQEKTYYTDKLSVALAPLANAAKMARLEAVQKALDSQ